MEHRDALNATQVRELLEGDEEVALLDVRQPLDFADRHLPTASNVPVDDPEFEARVRHIVPPEAIVIVYAERGSDADERGAARLEAMGDENVARFDGGLQAWKEAGFDWASRLAQPEFDARPVATGGSGPRGN